MVENFLALAKNSSQVIYLFVFLFVVFALALLYFFYLYWGGRKNDNYLSIKNIIHNFYCTLTLFSLGVTLICAHFFTLYFNSAGVIFLLMLLVCAYLFYLRWKHPFQAAVISTELEKVPLLIIIVVTFAGIGYSALCVFTHATLVVQALRAATILDIMDNLSEEDLKGGRVEKPLLKIPTPLERGGNTPGETSTLQSPEDQGVIGSALTKGVQYVTIPALEATLEAPAKQETIDLEKAALDQVSTRAARTTRKVWV